MENLISMTDFVLEQDCNALIGQREAFLNIVNYAEFITQPLQLWMFLPCDEEGNVLEQCSEICACECNKIILFREAKKRCLFEECVYDDEMEMIRSHIGDDLLYVPDNSKITIERLVMYKLKLTETAKNMFK